MKKILAILLACVMLFAVLAACADDSTPTPPPAPGEPTPAPPPEPGEPTDPTVGPTFTNITTQVDVPALGVEPTRQNTLIVGYNAPALGDFIGGFSIGAYDQTIWRLLHGMSTVQMFDAGGEIYVNPTVVADLDVYDDAEGNKTYTFEINSGLLWSDGTAISAFDYVTSVLWAASPEWQEAGAGWDSNSFMELVGWEAYQTGETEYFAGVRLIDDYTFSLTISNEELPYFFDLALVAFTPTPAHIYIPGMTITTDENG